MTTAAFLLASCAAGLLALWLLVKWLEPEAWWQWVCVVLFSGIIGLSLAAIVDTTLSLREGAAREYRAPGRLHPPSGVALLRAVGQEDRHPHEVVPPRLDSRRLHAPKRGVVGKTVGAAGLVT